MVMTIVPEAELYIPFASTFTGKVPVAVGVPRMRPKRPSQRKPGGKPEAENQLGLLFAVIRKVKGTPITPLALVALVMLPSPMVKVIVPEAEPNRFLAST